MWRNIVQSRWTTVAAIILLIFLGSLIGKKSPQLVLVLKDRHYLDEQLLEVERQEQKLQNEELLRSEVYLERQARLRLNYKNPGEEVVYVYHREPPGEAVPQESLAKEVSNLRQWWDYLMRD